MDLILQREELLNCSAGSSPGVSVSLEVELEQPEEGMLGQEESHTQGKELPALQCNTHNTQSLTSCH